MSFKIQLRDRTKSHRFVVDGSKAKVHENGALVVTDRSGQVFAVLAPGVWESAVSETDGQS